MVEEGDENIEEGDQDASEKFEHSEDGGMIWPDQTFA